MDFQCLAGPTNVSVRACMDLILVHTIQLKAHSLGKMVSSGISDVVIASAYSEKTRLKKLMNLFLLLLLLL